MKFRKIFRSRKGAGNPMMEVLLIIVAAGIGLIIITLVPGMLRDMFSLLSLASAETTARDLGGLITISAAAMEDVKIQYTGANEKIVYDVMIKDKIIEVRAFDADTLEPLDMATSMIYGYSKIPFDITTSISATNVFTIDKLLNEDEGKYEIYIV